MLRAYDRPGGIGIYSKNIIKYLLDIDRDNHYILFYNNKDHLGLFGNLKNVTEIYVHKTNAIIWDQVLIPRMIRRWNIDLIFNTKFTVPIFSKAKKIMALHGASWFVHPEIYKKLDLLYVKKMMKIYCSKADFLISNSNLTKEDHHAILDVPLEKMETVYFAAGKDFRLINDLRILQDVKAKYNLPQKFLLTVTSYDPGKNFGIILEAFSEVRKEEDIHLVVVGKNCYKFAEDYKLNSKNINNYVHFPGWIEHKELPIFYNLASVYLFPSVYETFGIPVIESLACGCPVVASNTGSIPEIVGDAAILIDPNNTQEFSQSIIRLLQDNALNKLYKERGFERAKNYSWERAAFQTLQIFNHVLDE